jgi:hypothetical protein
MTSLVFAIQVHTPTSVALGVLTQPSCIFVMDSNTRILSHETLAVTTNLSLHPISEKSEADNTSAPCDHAVFRRKYNFHLLQNQKYKATTQYINQRLAPPIAHHHHQSPLPTTQHTHPSTMYAKTLTVALFGFASTTLGAPVPDNDNFLSIHPSNGHCKDYTIANTVTSNNQVWTYPKFSNNYDVAAHLFNTTQSYRTDAASGTIGYNPFGAKPKEVTAKYTLEGTFCRPKEEKGGKEKTVLVATHGLGYDRRYWASSFQPEKYSFARAALEEGYSVFYYDRLGTGASQK